MKMDEIENIGLEFLDVGDSKEPRKAMIPSYQNTQDPYWEEGHNETLLDNSQGCKVVFMLDGPGLGTITPCHFSFPTNGINAVATTLYTGIVLIAEVVIAVTKGIEPVWRRSYASQSTKDLFGQGGCAIDKLVCKQK
ncbi:hypothetical protein FK220_014190 [Flavobacteriaceae bacterium TP-CH-4]|uniref:Uncharacterized protein n=1 Tax=Pelagihabitans pacificus TaxID=2696054 RepID=A0A967AU97_9FLAO|nr:hypothetical protein [Pelagihabitans pacificus]NHF60501.1 hypothetical protein [Pelagihabitans pacificus]